MVEVFRDSGFPVEVHARPGRAAPSSSAPRWVPRRPRASASVSAPAPSPRCEHFLAPGVRRRHRREHAPRVVGAALLANLRASFDGPIHPVGRGQSVLDVDGPVELAVVAVPARGGRGRRARLRAPRASRRCWSCPPASRTRRAGAGASAWRAFCRVGRHAADRPQLPRRRGPAAQRDVRRDPARTPAASRLISQSGGIGIAALEQGRGHGLGLSAFVSIGDRADVSSNDVIQWCEEDAGTDVIALYLESFGNPRRFARIARRVTRQQADRGRQGGPLGGGRPRRRLAHRRARRRVGRDRRRARSPRPACSAPTPTASCSTSPRCSPRGRRRPARGSAS